MIREDVGLNYEKHYIKIEAPATDGRTQLTLIHDPTMVKFHILTLL